MIFETFYVTHVRTSQKVKDVIMKTLWRIIVKTKISADFKLFTSVNKLTSDLIDRINDNSVEEKSKKS